jgi:hypothetical protein
LNHLIKLSAGKWVMRWHGSSAYSGVMRFMFKRERIDGWPKVENGLNDILTQNEKQVLLWIHLFGN